MQIGPTMQVKKHRTQSFCKFVLCALVKDKWMSQKTSLKATENPRAKGKDKDQKSNNKLVQNTNSTYRAFTKWSLKVKSCKNTLCFCFEMSLLSKHLSNEIAVQFVFSIIYYYTRDFATFFCFRHTCRCNFYNTNVNHKVMSHRKYCPKLIFKLSILIVLQF